MKIYRIFLKKSADKKIEDLELIKDGFNFYAFLFQVFYLLYKKLWTEALILFATFMALNLGYKFYSSYIFSVIQIGICIYLGFEYIDLKTKELLKNGYEFLGYTSGNDEKEAKLKFLETLDSDDKKEKMEKKIF